MKFNSSSCSLLSPYDTGKTASSRCDDVGYSSFVSLTSIYDTATVPDGQ